MLRTGTKVDTRKPDFLIIGAPKAGTTSLYKYLQQHPRLFLPMKEPKFYSFKDQSLDFRGHPKAIAQIKDSTIVDPEAYYALFAEAGPDDVCGEASPNYLHYENTAANIQADIPDAKLIAILRNPIQRLFSDWKHNLNMGWEKNYSFLSAVRAWNPRKSSTHYLPYLNYIPKGLYYRNLSRYFDRFPAGQIYVCYFEDLKKDPVGLLAEVQAFLGIDPLPLEPIRVFMKSKGLPRSVWLERALDAGEAVNQALFRSKRVRKKLKKERRKNRVSRPIRPDEFRFACDLYADDIEKLGRLLGRDFSHWLTMPPSNV